MNALIKSTTFWIVIVVVIAVVYYVSTNIGYKAAVSDGADATA